jgi:AraC-like DNA-binding protein
MECFTFSRQNTPFGILNDMFSSAAAENARKFYDGETTLCGEELNLHFELKMAPCAPYPTGMVSSLAQYTFRRTWNHIRANKENLVVLRYVKVGSLSITQGGSSCELGPGDFSFTRSNVPFHYTSKPAAQQPAEWYFILFPLDSVHRHFTNGAPMCMRLSTSTSRSLVMPQLLALLCEEGESIDRAVSDNLVLALLKTAADAAEEQGVQVGPRQSIGEKRLEGIIAYIDMHLANPDLSLSTVAQACQISQRYLCHLLKEHGTAFSDLLWTSRLAKSRDWIATLDKRRYTIMEIAMMAGFKSAAHFSRMFREHFGCSPREFRRSVTGEDVLHEADSVAKVAA